MAASCAGQWGISLPGSRKLAAWLHVLFQHKYWKFWEDQTLLVTLIHSITPCVTGAAMLGSVGSPLSLSLPRLQCPDCVQVLSTHPEV